MSTKRVTSSLRAPSGVSWHPSPAAAGFAAPLRRCALLNSLSATTRSRLLERLEIVTVPDGTRVIAAGSPPEAIVFVLAGRLRVSHLLPTGDSELVALLAPGKTAGESAASTAEPSPFDVHAAGEATIGRLARPALDELARSAPTSAEELGRAANLHLQRLRLRASLRTSRLLAELAPDVLRDVEECVEILTLASGDLLFREGDHGDSLYIILSGRVRVVVESADGALRQIAEFGRGESVGEMSVISGERRSATVVAIRDSHLAMLTRESFERLLTRHPLPITSAFGGTLVARLRQETSGRPRLGERIRTLAVEPLQPGLDLSSFCARLSEALRPFGRVAHLSSASVDATLGLHGIAQATREGADALTLVEWLCRLEQEHDFVLYEADSTETGWSHRCLRQADYVLRVADSDRGDPERSPREHSRPSGAREDLRSALVLRHPVRTHRPSGTLRWLEATGAVRHFHVGREDQESFDRLARVLVNRAVGLTLGGGFARGIAHVGVMRALADAGIPVDVVGGASMGAILAAECALGWEAETAIERTTRACADSFKDLTFPFVAFHRGRKFSRAITELFGDVQIEDLWLPFFCVSANLNRSELRIHTRGSLAKALLASTRAPGVFPPIVYDGDLHVDGGVINNVPVDLMIPFSNGGIVIGVDVSPPHELNAIADYGVEVDGWRAFWGRFNPFSRTRTYMPSILLILMRTLEFGGITLKQTVAERADLYLRPPLLAFKRTDFHLADSIAEVGYRHAAEAIDGWLAGLGPENDRRPFVRHEPARSGDPTATPERRRPR